MLRYIKSILLIQLLLLLSGCVQLPEYARPHLKEIDNKPEILKNGITDRQLTVDDFQALELPANIEPHAKNIEEQLLKTAPRINLNSPMERLSLSSLLIQRMPKIVSLTLMKD